MTDKWTDPAYLRYQYGDSEKLRIREETHRLYSERPNDFVDWVLAQLDVRPGDMVADVGCGSGFYHRQLGALGARVVALDYSAGMLGEALAQASAEGLPVAVVRGDAQALPLTNTSADRVMANHMLYHVPDQPAALAELRRVLRPGGRIVMATIAADQNQRLIDLHTQVAAERGLTAAMRGGARFTLDHLSLVRSVFPNAERRVRSDAFVFRSAEPALRYYASGLIDSVRERREDGAHRTALLAGMREQIEAIIAREGVFRVPKDAGCFVAEG